MSRRVVITGLGPITAFGVGLDPLWRAMVEGRSGIRRIEQFDPGGFACKIAAELNGDLFNVRKVIPKSYRKGMKVMCRDIELAVGAAAAAVADAGMMTTGLDPNAEPTIPPARMGCHIGAGLICAEVNELSAALWTSRNESGAFDLRHWGQEGMENLTPLWLLKYLPNMLACHVTIIHDCQGPSNTITCCEASSGLSIGESVRVIQRGAADACLSGGAESKVNLMAMLRQTFAGRLAPTADGQDPATVVRPFDPAASGTVVGEGGGLVVVEAADSAEGRGKAPYAEIAGYGSTQSFCPDTVGLQIDPDGEGIADAIEIALAQAGSSPDDVDAVVPLGCGILQTDQAEAAALKRVFGSRAARVPVVTTTPNVGNCNAGAGAVSVAVAAQALATQTLPARLNTVACDGLDAAACPSRQAELNHIVVFSTSQGGQNVALVLRRVE
ncbi:MAG: beta-ketoacyl-[acyl-carrier-protein] synthase family protein [Planctomycetota bacterium]|jgi:3-oxoacyl-[acyl-carrier-protein] synthase II